MTSRGNYREAAANRWLTPSTLRFVTTPDAIMILLIKTGSPTRGAGEAPPAWDKVWRASMRAYARLGGSPVSGKRGQIGYGSIIRKLNITVGGRTVGIAYVAIPIIVPPA